MIKKTLTFENHDGKTVTKTYHFHMNKAELAEMQLSAKGGLAEELRAILATGDGGLIMSTFKGLMMQTVGKRSEDGELFRKTQDIRDEFEFSGAYSAMFMEMIADTNLALEFIKGIMPADVTAKADFSDLEKLTKEGGREQFTTDALQALLKDSPDGGSAAERMAQMTAIPETFRAAKPVSEMSVEEMRAALEGRQQL